MVEKSKKPAVTITLTDDERRSLDKLRWFAHCDTDKGENSYAEYQSKLKDWTDKIRKKHNLEDKEPFFTKMKRAEGHKKLCVGDIVRMDWKEEGKKIFPYRYVVVAVAPSNGLSSDRVDVIKFEDASVPLKKTGIGMPIKYLIKVGRITNERNNLL